MNVKLVYLFFLLAGGGVGQRARPRFQTLANLGEARAIDRVHGAAILKPQ